MKRNRRLIRRQGLAEDTTLESSTLVLFAHMAASVYCPKDEISAWNCAPCKQFAFEDYKVVNVTTKVSSECGEIQSAIGYSANQNAIILTFRGTSNFGNFICDVDFDKCPTSLSIGGRVHCGFLTAWRDLRENMFYHLTTLMNANGRGNSAIYFVGHSLGGAIANIAAVDWFDNNGKSYGYESRNLGVITYGSPRVFDDTAAKGFENIGFGVSYRAVHNQDVVARLPPKFTSYRHVYRELFQREDTVIVKCNDAIGVEETNCANLVPGISVSDHLSFAGIPIGCNPYFAAIASDVYCHDTYGRKTSFGPYLYESLTRASDYFTSKSNIPIIADMITLFTTSLNINFTSFDHNFESHKFNLQLPNLSKLQIEFPVERKNNETLYPNLMIMTLQNIAHLSNLTSLVLNSFLFESKTCQSLSHTLDKLNLTILLLRLFIAPSESFSYPNATEMAELGKALDKHSKLINFTLFLEDFDDDSFKDDLFSNLKNVFPNVELELYGMIMEDVSYSEMASYFTSLNSKKLIMNEEEIDLKTGELVVEIDI
ncbi:hypothetical protein HK098_000460 [Nowakowskiella sp. JEL0407]|nr:hypothetical protein HK098_000460 [Nowakowskiella sp. JEL0407]